MDDYLLYLSPSLAVSLTFPFGSSFSVPHTNALQKSLNENYVRRTTVALGLRKERIHRSHQVRSLSTPLCEV